MLQQKSSTAPTTAPAEPAEIELLIGLFQTRPTKPRQRAGATAITFDLDDFLNQLQQAKKLGPLEQVLQMIPGVGQAMRQQQVSVNDDDLKQIEGIIWHWMGQHAQNSQLGTDSQVQHSGNASGYLRVMTATTNERAGLEQLVNAQGYAGKRIRFSAYLKTQDVKNSAGLEVDVDDLLGNTVSRDNLEGSLAHGTTGWGKYEIVVDVPTKAYLIHFGPRLDGTGQIWIDDAQIDIVGEASPAQATQTITPAPATVIPK